MSTSQLWHERFGHLNLASLNEIHCMIADLLEITDFPDVCEACMMGKQHRRPFPKKASRVKAPLELLHMDLCGKMETEALG